MRSSFDLEGKTALVTGAARGLGFEGAKALARHGARVLINGRSAETLSAAAEQIAAAGAEVEILPFDVTDEAAVTRAFQAIRERHGTLDILVNNAGARDRRSLFDLDLAAVRRLLEIHLLAPFHLSREAAKLMSGAGERGRIVNITSIAGPLSAAGDTAYTAAKGGLESLTRSLAAELGPRGINVNAIAPGFFATEANQERVRDEALGRWLAQRTSIGRWGEPHEIAGAVVFLCSPAASYVTGHVLAVDGGYLAHF